MDVTCKLPGGLWDAGGVRHWEAEVSPLTGREEELLADRALLPAAAVTTLLSRRVRRIGDLHPVTEAMARELSVGDREVLLLKLRQLTFGDKVEAVARCVWPDCGEQVDLEFLISQIPIREAATAGPLCELTLSAEAAEQSGLGGGGRIRFRLPTGADQETLSPLLGRDAQEAATQLLARCLQSVEGRAPDAALFEGLSPLARLEIERAMERAAPGAELTMEARCPECGRAFAVPFAVQDFFLGEMRGSRDLLMREVHYLAYHYHWSEREILDLPRERRRGYIDIISAEMERLNDAVT